MQSLLKKALFAGALSLALAACNSVNLDNGSIGGGGTTNPTNKDPNITGVSINGNQLIGKTGDVWISGDADVVVRATSSVGLKSLSYSIAGQSGNVDVPKAINEFRISNLTAGPKTLTIVAKNNKDVEHKVDLPVKVDLTAPTVGVLSPAEAGSGSTPKVNGIVTLKVAVNDNESGVAGVRFFQKGETTVELTDVTRNNSEYTTQIDTTKLEDGVRYFEIQVRNNAGLTTSSIVGLNVVNSTELPAPTAPVVRLLLAPGEKTGTITIPFIISSEDNIKVAKLLVNGELYKTIPNAVSNVENTFTLDVSLLPLGTHTISVAAETVRGKSSTSNSVEIQVTKNLSLPLFKISSPQSGAALGGKTPIEVSVVKKGSDFTFLSDITVQVIGYGGTVVKTLTIAKSNLVNNGDGIYLTDAVDWPRLTGADAYDIRAFASISVDDGTAAADPQFTVADQLTTEVTITNKKPPAANILVPSRNDPSSVVPSAILNRNGGIFLQITDEDKLDPNTKYRVDVRLISKNPGGGAKITKYLYNLPLLSGTFFHGISELLLDGSEYVENGAYTLQTISEDNDGNGNVQEVNIVVDRSAPNLARVNANSLTVLVNAPYAPGKPDKQSATWRLCSNLGGVTTMEYTYGTTPPTIPVGEQCTPVNFTNPTTVIAAVMDGIGTVSEKQILNGFTGNAPSYTVSFAAAGTYSVTFFAQDLITGNVQVFTGPSVGVSIYQN